MSEPRWRRPPVLVGEAVERDPVYVSESPKRYCQRASCGKPLSALNSDVFCFRCQQCKTFRLVPTGRRTTNNR